MPMRLLVIKVCKVSWHNTIIHLFDKPGYPWYKVWGYKGLDRNVQQGESFRGS